MNQKSVLSYFHPKVETGYFKTQVLIVYQYLYSFYMFLSLGFEACVLIVYENAVCRVADVPENIVMACVGHLQDLMFCTRCACSQGVIMLVSFSYSLRAGPH
jgi:hypothetical protein